MSLSPCKPRAGSCELSRDPARPASPFCYWHRLSYCNGVAQIEAARARISGKAVQSPGGSAVCIDCGPVPSWYLKGRRCAGCKARHDRDRRVTATYQLEPGGYERLFDYQGGRCAICRNAPTGRRRLVVDHNHRTGAVRGLLCDRCNHDLLGGAHDDVMLLARAVLYITGHDPDRAVGIVSNLTQVDHTT